MLGSSVLLKILKSNASGVLLLQKIDGCVESDRWKFWLCFVGSKLWAILANRTVHVEKKLIGVGRADTKTILCIHVLKFDLDARLKRNEHDRPNIHLRCIILGRGSKLNLLHSLKIEAWNWHLQADGKSRSKPRSLLSCYTIIIFFGNQQGTELFLRFNHQWTAPPLNLSATHEVPISTNSWSEAAYQNRMDKVHGSTRIIYTGARPCIRICTYRMS